MTDLLSPDVVERRTAIAKMRQLELSVAKEEISLEEKKKNICRIDAALSEFDAFLSDFVEMLISFPDKVQSIVKGMTPEEYGELQSFIDEQMQRLAKKKLYLAIESTSEEKALATAAKEESIKKNAKIKKGKK